MAKRFLDILAASLGLVISSPALFVVASLIRRQMGASILFRQNRPRLDGAPFQMVKFRTMRDAVDAQGNHLPDGQRLTPLGRFMRSASLDELPELWNVLKGDMSIVGPRPLLMEYLPLYSPEQARRHEVRPGITGWAQVNGRNAISWDEKFALYALALHAFGEKRSMKLPFDCDVLNVSQMVLLTIQSFVDYANNAPSRERVALGQ